MRYLKIHEFRMQVGEGRVAVVWSEGRSSTCRYCTKWKVGSLSD